MNNYFKQMVNITSPDKKQLKNREVYSTKVYVGVSLKITNKLIILLNGESGCLTL